MSEPMDHDDVTPDEAELARLADGSLAPAQRADARERAEADPERAAALAEQQRAVSLMRSTDDAVAPASLRMAISELTEETQPRPGRRDPTGMRLSLPRWRRALMLPGAAALAVIVIGIVIATGGSGTPSVRSAARVALAPATQPAPAADAHDTDVLAIRGAGIPFPAYLRRAGWRASGARQDEIHGRRVTTVFYRAPGGARVGYAIVSGAALGVPAGDTRTVGGTAYRFASLGSARLVTWRRDGHTCVIAGESVSDRTLLALAAADERAV